uniref:Uncharacterized protein n=1 Tax=Lepeophtheirus salmonis TaxID=72036 RepID=A0A0K2VA47_LEPSM
MLTHHMCNNKTVITHICIVFQNPEDIFNEQYP